MFFQRLCRITEKARLTSDTVLLTLDGGDIAKIASPGQFVHILCGEGRILRRPISICFAEGVRLGVAVQDKGEGTHWLVAREVGDTLDVMGPLGHGFSKKSGKTVILGGGLGVPPMLFAAMSEGEKPDAILGFRSAENVMLTDSFIPHCESVTVTTDDGTFGERGSVIAPLEALLSKGGYAFCKCCGPVPMLKAVAQCCKKYGVYCEVSMEQRMGCGIGACLVCSCSTHDENGDHMSRVCRDGPVFNAEEVNF